VPEAEFVQPLTVMVLEAVAEVARFHQTVPAPLVSAFWLATFAHRLPPVSLSTTVGSVVAPRLVTAKRRMSPVTTPELITSVKPVCWFPLVLVAVPTEIAIVTSG
jgi:hypothetical protein